MPLNRRSNNGGPCMRMFIAAATAAVFVAGTALAQPASPVPGSQPGTKAPGSDLPKNDGSGSGSAAIGPPAPRVCPALLGRQRRAAVSNIGFDDSAATLLGGSPFSIGSLPIKRCAYQIRAAPATRK